MIRQGAVRIDSERVADSGLELVAGQYLYLSGGQAALRQNYADSAGRIKYIEFSCAAVLTEPFGSV